VASASDDNDVRLWESATRALLSTLKGHSAPVWDVIFSLDGKLLVSAAGNGTVRFWDIKFSLGGKLVAFACGDGAVRLWESAKGGKA
jgi:WD40 repeat protein